MTFHADRRRGISHSLAAICIQMTVIAFRSAFHVQFVTIRNRLAQAAVFTLRTDGQNAGRSKAERKNAIH